MSPEAPLHASRVAPPVAAASDSDVDGVPLPRDVRVAVVPDAAPAAHRQLAGVWTGTWGGTLRHILVVEEIATNGDARVVYAIGDNPGLGIRREWSRQRARIGRDGALALVGTSFEGRYEPRTGGGLRGFWSRGPYHASARLERADLATLLRPGAAVAWARHATEMLATDLIGDGTPVRLEVVLYRPDGAGPFPLAVINHGSTGEGTDPTMLGATWHAAELADELADRGWLVAFPQRRGRGKSDGLYDEGFADDRRQGYSDEPERALAGFERGLDDLAAAIAALRRRPDVAAGPILIGGQSRGGALSVAYAGARPGEVAGVLNFVGGWLNEASPAAHVNAAVMARGGGFNGPMLWLYGRGDPFYTIAHSRASLAAFERAGGRASFVELNVPHNEGHGIIWYRQLWHEPLATYLRGVSRGGGERG